MAKNEKLPYYGAIISTLAERGVDFRKSAFALTGTERDELKAAAAVLKYRLPRLSYLDVAASFFQYLKKYI